MNIHPKKTKAVKKLKVDNEAMLVLVLTNYT